MNTRSKLLGLAFILIIAEVILIPIGLKIKKDIEFKKWEVEWEADYASRHPAGYCWVEGCDNLVSSSDSYCYTHTCNINGCSSLVQSYGRCKFHKPTSDHQRVFDEEKRCHRPNCYSWKQQGSNYCYDHRDLAIYDP